MKIENEIAIFLTCNNMSGNKILKIRINARKKGGIVKKCMFYARRLLDFGQFCIKNTV